MILAFALGAVAATFGACAGSYASTVAVRLARKEQATLGRSRCDGCRVELGFAQTVPIVSYLTRRGACAACGARIDPLHLIGELGGAAVVLAALAVAPAPRGILIGSLGLILLASVLIDARTRRLPDVLTAIAGILCALLVYTGSGSSGFVVGAGAAAATFLIMELVRRGFLRLRGRPGLGFGDVKLAAVLAIWLGLATPWAIVIASAIGLLAFLVVRPTDGRIPFGPALAFGGFLVGLLQEAHLWPQP